jgi:eukaryotic-like serine/threonine-protein kinase
MTPERWQQIRDVLGQALSLAPEQRSAFLNRACSSDSDLREEVETLLASNDHVRSSFLESPPERVMLTSGTKLGDYEIKSLLGAGGMGEVYRARDARLGRDVAIKVLPAMLSADSERLRRFEQEARAAAALNHPNILAVHQMGTHGGSPYLVSELLEGETLRELLKRGRLVVRKAIDYGVQIARGLAAAHEKGVVHRDLKPENLFVTKDGRVKILDFGLAKLTEPQSGSDPVAPTIGGETEPGAVMGTVGYMSPEQVRGQNADHRTDIFSFGAILYEMLAGKRAFQKPTAADTQSAILNEDPASISQVTTSIPPALQRVVHRCLEKNPEQRFQSASDLAFALDALSSTSDSTTASAAVRPAPHRMRRKWLAAGTLSLVIFALLFLWWRTPPPAPQITGITQITNDGISKRGTVLATDGSRLYFSEGEDLGWQLMQVSITGGETAPVATTVPHPWFQSLAPDYSGILLTTTQYVESPLWWQPLPAGAARRLGDLQVYRASLLPDGEHVVYSNKGIISVADRDGSNPEVLANVGPTGPLSISPDGQRIRFNTYDRALDLRVLWELDMKTRNVHQLLNGWNGSLQTGSWTGDGRYFLFTRQIAGRRDIWALPDDPGLLQRRGSEPIRLTAGPLSYGFPALGRDGQKIYTVGTMRRGQMVRFDAASQQFVPFLSGLPAIQLSFSKDGEWIVYTSYPDHALWRCRKDGTERSQLTYPPLASNGGETISPDGSQVAFTGFIEGQGLSLYVVDMKGGEPRMVAKAGGGPAWSPDGNELTFSALKNGSIDYELRTIDLRSGMISPIPDGLKKRALTWSPQGKLAAIDFDGGVFILDPRTQKWSELFKGQCAAAAISPDGAFLYCETSSLPRHEVVRIRLSDGRAETVMEIKGLRRVVDDRIGTALSVTPYGSVLLTRDEGSEEIYALSVKWP